MKKTIKTVRHKSDQWSPNQHQVSDQATKILKNAPRMSKLKTRYQTCAIKYFKHPYYQRSAKYVKLGGWISH